MQRDPYHHNYHPLHHTGQDQILHLGCQEGLLHGVREGGEESDALHLFQDPQQSDLEGSPVQMGDEGEESFRKAAGMMQKDV